MQQYFTEEEFPLWDSDWHEQQLHDIENAGSPFLEKYFSKQYGVNRRSLFAVYQTLMLQNSYHKTCIYFWKEFCLMNLSSC